MRWLADWAAAQVYAFASVDYSGAAISQVYDSDGTTTVGAFNFGQPAARGWLAAMVKTAPPPEILGRPLSDSGVRSRYDITVVGVKRPGRGVTHATPTPSCTRATF